MLSPVGKDELEQTTQNLGDAVAKRQQDKNLNKNTSTVQTLKYIREYYSKYRTLLLKKMKELHGWKLLQLSYRSETGKAHRDQDSISKLQAEPAGLEGRAVLLPGWPCWVSTLFVTETHHSRKDFNCISLLATAQKERLAQTPRIIIIPVIMNSKPKYPGSGS